MSRVTSTWSGQSVDVGVSQIFTDVLRRAERLSAACRVAVDALGLQAGDVVATLVPVTLTVAQEWASTPGDGRETRSWPVVVIHGSARRPDSMTSARERLRDLVGSWPGARGDAWVTWQLP
jgi:hypothetical protein